MLLNLLTNAIKFTPEGGTVQVNARMNHGNILQVEVADTGIGMDDDDLRRALQPFGQAGDAMTRPHEGTGLGLPLAVRLVELHGGTLSFDSTVGVGTTVTVCLPAGQAH